MKFFVVLFWSLILSEISGFVIGKLNDTSFQPNLVAIIAVVFTVLIFIIDKIAIPKDPQAKASK
ncbi:YjzD family protein [Pseudolactococcus laudensis]|uniref:YjzD family protein n=1 Tax=Pseudolactococcus laudensis TaxID=1494461 RepID=UPI002FC5D273